MTPSKKTEEEKEKQGCWIGVDGTRTGWVAFIWQDDDNYQLWHINKLQELASLVTQYQVNGIGIDIPIGLLEVAEKGGRGCDRKGRNILSTARRNAMKKSSSFRRQEKLSLVGSSSIFTPPCRRALEVAFPKSTTNNEDKCCCTHAQVSAANKESVVELVENGTTEEGLGLSIQTYHILPKIKEADDFVHPSKDSTSRNAVAFEAAIPVLECHPELAFLSLTLNKDNNLEEAKALYSKKIIQGRRQRLELLCKKAKLDTDKLLSLALLGGVGDKGSASITDQLDHLAKMRTWRIEALSSKHIEDGKWISVAADDVLDAMVCASTSKRWSLGQAKVVSEKDSTVYDNRNLPMLIWT